MEQIRRLKDLTKNDAALAGGKGASLGEMTRANFQVPDGFVILSIAFDKNILEKFGSEINEILSVVDQKDIKSISLASNKIQKIILESKFPKDLQDEIVDHFNSLNCKFVAVRSSATAEDSADTSWAGELESFLNTTQGNFLHNIKKCWASLYTPRAIYYRCENNLANIHVSVAVVVQGMIQSEVSGIAFTVHPVSKNPDIMLIEAGFGLGEAIVSGSITPDNYAVEKNGMTIEDIKVSFQETMIVMTNEANSTVAVNDNKKEIQKLSGSQIIKLAEICLNIEKHYGFPCDIEWAFENDKFYIVQSRPITTL